MILLNLGKENYFITLELKSGSHHSELAERDREKTSVCVSEKYEFCRQPFGLINAPNVL